MATRSALTRALIGAGAGLACVGALVSGALALGLDGGAGARHSRPAALSRADVGKAFGRLPLRFEANRGQAPHSVDFLARGPGYTMVLGHDGAVLALTNGKAAAARAGSSSAIVGMHLIGANPAPAVAGSGPLAGASNYLLGPDRRQWHTGVPSFAQVRYQGVYPGVDMVYRGNQRELEYDLVVAPGSDPGHIALGFRGAQRLSITRGGDLLIQSRGGAVRQRHPVVYQGDGAARRFIAGRYVLGDGGRRVEFRVGSYDHSRPLVLDPSIVYSTFLGGYNTAVANGSSQDTTNGIAVDAEGNAFVVGFTDSIPPTPFPTTPSALQTRFGGGSRDGFVTKLSADGKSAVYSTYLGGSAEDRATGVAVGPDGKAYVSGLTVSTDFPTKNPIQPANGGGARDAFVAELNMDGTGLVYSTYLGGSGTDTANRIAVDATGAAYVVGNTAPARGSVSDDFPTTPGSFQTTFGGGAGPTAPGDAFVTKIKPLGAGLDYSTFLGGDKPDTGAGIAVDPGTGAAYVAGGTSSTAIFGSPKPPGLQKSYAGGSGQDAYVAKLNPAGSALIYATYLGGTADDSAAGIGVDSSGNTVITGSTNSTDLPVVNANQPNNASAPGPNSYDGFVAKLDPAGTTLVYSTYNGSPSYDTGNDIAVDPTGNAYAVGNTLGSFPLKNPVQVRTGDYDGYLTKFDPSGVVVYSTIYGGPSRDFAQAVAADGAGNAYIGGRTDYYGPDAFPVKNAFQPQNGGYADAWVAKISSMPTSPLVNSLRSRNGPVDGGTPVTITGTGFTGATAVSFGATPAASFQVDSDSQITAVTPPHAPGQVNVIVTAPAGVSPDNPVSLFEYAEGRWSLTGSLNLVHYDHQLTLLNDGRVLLTGGENSFFGSTITSSELYSPKTRTWSSTGDLKTPRSAYTVTRLDGPACRAATPPAYCGDVLVSGGSPDNAGDNTALKTAETYHPATGTWSYTTGSLNVARSQHAATLLDGPECHAGSPPAYCGKVLVTGGFGAGSVTLSSSELYDPATGLFSTTGSMLHTARLTLSVLLPNGKVLLAGGTGSNPAGTEIYDPGSGSWSVTDSLKIPRQRGSLVVLDDGKVLAASGIPPGDPPTLATPPQAGDSAELYDPVAGTWTLLPDRLIDAARDNHDTAVLPSGKVLLAGGGRGGITSELFDPLTNRWSSAGLLNISRGSGNPASSSFDTVVLSSDSAKFAANAAVCGNDCGKVLVAGNTDDKSAELYTPPPRVDTLTPGSGGAGTPVRITGQGFTHAVRSVLFGSMPATSFTVDSYGQITAIAPAGDGSVPITVVNEGGTSTSAGPFAFPGSPGPGPGPGPGPNPMPGPVPGPAAGKRPQLVRVSLSGLRLSARRRARGRRTIFMVRGVLRLPRSIPAAKRASVCRGRVTVTVRRGRRNGGSRTVGLGRDCAFSVAISVPTRKLGGRGRYNIRVRFPGNANLNPRSQTINIR